MLGRITKRSQEMLRANRCSVDKDAGRMIHRATRDTTSGESFDDFKVDRKVRSGFGVVG